MSKINLSKSIILIWLTFDLRKRSNLTDWPKKEAKMFWPWLISLLLGANFILFALVNCSKVSILSFCCYCCLEEEEQAQDPPRRQDQEREEQEAGRGGEGWWWHGYHRQSYVSKQAQGFCSSPRFSPTYSSWRSKTSSSRRNGRHSWS